MKVSIPFGAWYGDREITLDFPEEWCISVHRLKATLDIGDQGISEALNQPIGSKPLAELAEGRRSAAIIVDDLTRPTPAHRLLPYVLKELRKGGVVEERVKVVMAIAAHRPLVGIDLEKKLGREILDSIEVLNHNPYENLVRIGESGRGTPIYLNGDVYEAGLKIGVGSIVPHPAAGFGGGAKSVLPGVVGMETIEHNHYKLPSEGGHGFIEGNSLRLDMEEVARRVGLDIIVNTVVNERREIAGLFIGDLVAAHRAGVGYGKAVYGTPIEKRADVLVTNAYPIDSELVQAGKALWARGQSIKEKGTVVLVTASSEGLGHHYLVERMRRRSKAKVQANMEVWKNLIVFSPNLGAPAVQKVFPGAEAIKTWREVLEELKSRHSGKVEATVLACGSIQCPDADGDSDVIVKRTGLDFFLEPRP